jgi:predicted phosphodiesterase
MRFLCVSDVHGHAAKLRKVVDEATLWGFDQLICCGDLLFPGPEPMETWKILLETKALCVQGLTDKAIAQIDPDSLEPRSPRERERFARLVSLHDQLGELIVARLGRLKHEARLPLESGHEMLVIHGSPSDPTEPMSLEMSDDELNALIADDPADIIVCGGSHVPFERQVGQTRIVNVGSVGESPAEGFAHATIVESSPLGVTVKQFDVDV